MNQLNLERLKFKLHHSEWRETLSAADELGAASSSLADTILIEGLSSTSPRVRNASAIAIKDNETKNALPALVKAISKPENINSRGTLVSALEAMDCSELFMFLFRLALDANYECKMGATDVLAEQEFYIDDNDIALAKSMLSARESSNDNEENKALFSWLEELLEDLSK
jgi:HEAT repeat protein